MKGLLNNWNVVRLLRLVLGIAVIVQGIYTRHVAYLVAGSVLALMALANAGCCGASGCAVDTRGKKAEKEIVYEEVDSTK